MIDDPDVTAIVAIICPTGQCEDCARKARDVIVTFDGQRRLIPAGVSMRVFTEWRWQHVRTGAEQTALAPQEAFADWARVKRRSGRWYTEWERVDE